MAKATKRNTENENKKGNPYFNLDAEKAFFEEVDEEVRNERFKQLINKYGVYILSILIIVLSFAVGYEKIWDWKIKKAEQQNIKYVEAIAPKSNYETNIAELQNIVESETGIYKDIAYLQIANILLDNNQTERALEVLDKIYNDTTVSDKIREIAAIKIATYKVDTAKFSDIEVILNPIVEKNGAWAPFAKELLAMSAIQNKDFERAKAIYQELQTNANISDDFRARINDMLASINEAN